MTLTLGAVTMCNSCEEFYTLAWIVGNMIMRPYADVRTRVTVIIWLVCGSQDQCGFELDSSS
jgi:hypothetical protein